MNWGQVLGWILIISGILLSIALVLNSETGNYVELSTFFSAYAGICFSAGAITLLKTRDKHRITKIKLGEIRVFSERD